jgi:3'(2'), 5'-bisphosphate nucleotidase
VSAGDLSRLLTGIVALAREAGAETMKYYGGTAPVRTKADASPVTDADEAAEAIILAGLARLAPDVPAISEEAMARGMAGFTGAAPAWFWLVDPLDGTREFVSRNGEFTVNIALIHDGAPVLGVVHAPAIGVLYAGGAGRAMQTRGDAAPAAIRARRAPANGITVVESRSHGDRDATAAFLGDFTVAERKPAGSSLKFGLIAEGAADLYPRLGPTMEWDTAAGHAVLDAAGGRVTTLSGAPLRYGKPGFKNPDFVAHGAK